MHSFENTMKKAAGENDFDTPKKRGGARDIRTTLSEELDRIKALSQKIIDAVSDITSKDITKKIALMALTVGALHVAAEKPAFADASQYSTAEQPPSATESATQNEQDQAIKLQPTEYVHVGQKEEFTRFFEDKEKVIPLIEKQGLILTPDSIETRTTIVYFNEAKKGAHTLTALIRAVDENTIELRVYNSNNTLDIITFQKGDVISAVEIKSE